VSSVRTKALFALSALPPIFVAAAAAWAVIYLANLTQHGKATYFVIFHVHWLRWLPISTVLFVAGLFSLFYDRRNAGEK
jgi:hypothetical protein